MIKGVNKHIIEVLHTDSDYFEKAILFINPNKAGEDKERLLGVAKGYLGELQYKERRAIQKKTLAKKIFQRTIIFLFGMACAALIFWWL